MRRAYPGGNIPAGRPWRILIPGGILPRTIAALNIVIVVFVFVILVAFQYCRRAMPGGELRL